MRITKVLSLIPIAVVVTLSGAACNEPSDDRPNTPKTIRSKYIDPESKTCSQYKRVNKKRKCVKWKTDDKDWVLVTTDGAQYDVDEDEYNSVNDGDSWPTS